MLCVSDVAIPCPFRPFIGKSPSAGRTILSAGAEWREARPIRQLDRPFRGGLAGATHLSRSVAPPPPHRFRFPPANGQARESARAMDGPRTHRGDADDFAAD